jgi:hypothetical protein
LGLQTETDVGNGFQRRSGTLEAINCWRVTGASWFAPSPKLGQFLATFSDAPMFHAASIRMFPRESWQGFYGEGVKDAVTNVARKWL